MWLKRTFLIYGKKEKEMLIKMLKFEAMTGNLSHVKTVLSIFERFYVSHYNICKVMSVAAQEKHMEIVADYLSEFNEEPNPLAVRNIESHDNIIKLLKFSVERGNSKDVKNIFDSLTSLNIDPSKVKNLLKSAEDKKTINIHIRNLNDLYEISDSDDSDNECDYKILNGENFFGRLTNIEMFKILKLVAKLGLESPLEEILENLNERDMRYVSHEAILFHGKEALQIAAFHENWDLVETIKSFFEKNKKQEFKIKEVSH